VYATKAAIIKAITELEALFPKGEVSTDSDVLRAHGFSVGPPNSDSQHMFTALSG
jgi:hypothetical protein